MQLLSENEKVLKVQPDEIYILQSRNGTRFQFLQHKDTPVSEVPDFLLKAYDESLMQKGLVLIDNDPTYRQKKLINKQLAIKLIELGVIQPNPIQKKKLEKGDVPF